MNSGVYGIAMGIKRGKCQENGCTKCPHYEAADDGDGGPCLNCGHFPGNHENLGSVEDDNSEKIYYDDPDPLGLLQEPGDGEENQESIKQLQDMCEWSISGNELRFLEKLGSGRTAKVYKGLYKNQTVAIKVLKPILEDKELRNFKGELDIMRMVDSKHVVKFYGGCLQPKICLVMEYCSNGSLYHLLQRKEFKFEWPLFFRLNTETVLGVLALHTMSPPIVHRDLKSLNLLVNSEYSVKVCDFGVSRYTAGSSDDSTLGKVRGTLAYTAPEIYFGKKFSTKSDVFSLGIILWEYVARMFTGEYQRPYKEFNFKIDFQVLFNVAKKLKRPTIPPGVPESLKNLITSCWSQEPVDRPDTAQIQIRLAEIQQEYENNKQEWDSKLQNDSPTPDLDSNDPSVINESASKKPSETSQQESESSGQSGTVWAHKTADQVFGPNVLEGGSSVDFTRPKRSVSRSASKRIISMVGSRIESPSVSTSNPTPVGSAEPRWAHKTADELLANGSLPETKPEIAVSGPWRHTNGDWRDEDDFPDEDPKKKKKKRGLLDRLKTTKKKK